MYSPDLKFQHGGLVLTMPQLERIKSVLVIDVNKTIVIFVSKKELNVITFKVCMRSILESPFSVRESFKLVVKSLYF